jgi:hypothetical protein
MVKLWAIYEQVKYAIEIKTGRIGAPEMTGIPYTEDGVTKKTPGINVYDTPVTKTVTVPDRVDYEGKKWKFKYWQDEATGAIVGYSPSITVTATEYMGLRAVYGLEAAAPAWLGVLGPVVAGAALSFAGLRRA